MSSSVDSASRTQHPRFLLPVYPEIAIVPSLPPQQPPRPVRAKGCLAVHYPGLPSLPVTPQGCLLVQWSGETAVSHAAGRRVSWYNFDQGQYDNMSISRFKMQYN